MKITTNTGIALFLVYACFYGIVYFVYMFFGSGFSLCLFLWHCKLCMHVLWFCFQSMLHVSVIWFTLYTCSLVLFSVYACSLILYTLYARSFIVQELCESRDGRPGLSVVTSLLISVDVKLY